jgi:hypothetical protein
VPNPFSVVSVLCDGGILKVIYNDRGECKTVASEGAGHQFDGAITIPNLIHTQIPGFWTLLFGDLSKIGIEKSGNIFANITQADINLKVSLQYGWTPFSVTGTSRLMYIKRNNSNTDIVLANYAASNNTDVAQLGSNTFVLKPGEYFQPWAWQNSGANAYLGQTGIDLSTNLIVPSTTITIERLFSYN